MATRINFVAREVVIVPPRPTPGKDDRAALHQELDEALDELLAHDTRKPEPDGPGRIADEDGA